MSTDVAPIDRNPRSSDNSLYKSPSGDARQWKKLSVDKNRNKNKTKVRK